MSDVRCQMAVKRSLASLNFQLSTDISHLTSTSWWNYANTLARSALRRENIVEETRLHFDRRARHRAGHRRRHDDLQRRGRDYVAAFFVFEPGTIDDALREQAGSGDHARFGVAGQRDRVARAITDVTGSGRHARSRLHLDRRRAA